MSDKRYTKDGEYLSKAATLELNERHGWLQYGDAQSEASNAFANNAVHAFLESAKQAQEVMAETGLTPRQLVEQRDELLLKLKMATDALSGGLWDYGPGQDEHERCNEVIAECVGTIANIEGRS